MRLVTNDLQFPRVEYEAHEYRHVGGLPDEETRLMLGLDVCNESTKDGRPRGLDVKEAVIKSGPPF